MVTRHGAPRPRRRGPGTRSPAPVATAGGAPANASLSGSRPRAARDPRPAAPFLSPRLLDPRPRREATASEALCGHASSPRQMWVHPREGGPVPPGPAGASSVPEPRQNAGRPHGTLVQRPGSGRVPGFKPVPQLRLVILGKLVNPPRTLKMDKAVVVSLWCLVRIEGGTHVSWRRAIPGAPRCPVTGSCCVAAQKTKPVSSAASASVRLCAFNSIRSGQHMHAQH